MTEQEQITRLQEELKQLQAQMKGMQQSIQEMYELVTGLPSAKRGKGFSMAAKESKGHSAFLENFIGLNLVHFAGIIVLLIGLSIGVKYAIDKKLISEMMRIFLAYSAGLLLYVLSVRLQKNYVVFSAILFSGAMASLYFTTYAAFVYYAIFSFASTFIIMVALTFYTVFKALKYDRSEIGLLGLLGGYAIPFLISHNSERPDLFFMYISLINIAIVFLYVKRDWKSVGHATCILTWLIFLGWITFRFKPGQEWIGIFFLVFFYLLFILMNISLKLFKRKGLLLKDTNYVLFNSLMFYSGAILICRETHGLTFSGITISMSVLLGVETILARYYWPLEKRLKNMLAGLCLFYFIVFIALAWNGFTVTLLWLLTSFMLFAAGVFFKSVSIRLASIILMALTLFKLVVFDSLTFTSVEKVISYITLGILLLLVSFFYQKFRDQLFGNKGS